MEGLDGFWIFVHPLPHHKKGGFNLILAQDVDEHLGVLIPPGGVKRDGEDLLVPLDAVDGKLAGGGGGSDNGGVDVYKRQWVLLWPPSPAVSRRLC